jgi:hypothetical protein
VGYVSRRAGVLLWLLGLVITSTVIYLVYSAAVSYLPSVATWVLATLFILAWIAILVFWATVLSRGVSGQPDKSGSRWTTICETLTRYGAPFQLDARSTIENAKPPIILLPLSLLNLWENWKWVAA